MVITPSRIADIDITVVELSEEFETNSQSTSSGYGLGGDDSSFLNSLAVLAEDELLSSSVELGKTVNGEIFLINGKILSQLEVNLTDDLEGVGLFIVVSIGTDTQVHFIFAGVSFVGQGGTQDRIRGG